MNPIFLFWHTWEALVKSTLAVLAKGLEPFILWIMASEESDFPPCDQSTSSVAGEELVRGDYGRREKPRIHQAALQNPLGSTEDGMMLARKSKEKMEGMTGLRVEQRLQSEGSVLHNAERTHTSSVSQLCPMRCSQSRLPQKVMETSQSEDLTRGTLVLIQFCLVFFSSSWLLLVVIVLILNECWQNYLPTKLSVSKLVYRAAEPPCICQLLFCFTSI